MEVTLPTTPNVPVANLATTIQLWVGEKGVGKSSLLAKFPNVFIMEGAVGMADHLPVRKLDIPDWVTFKRGIDLLEKNPSYCATIGIDELDQIYSHCYKYVRSMLKMADTDSDNFDVWRTIRNLFDYEIKRLVNLRKGIIFTTHTKTKEFKDRGGNVTHKVESALSSQCNELMDCLVNCWFIMQFTTNGERVMVIEGDDFMKASHKFTDHFLNPADNNSRLTKIPLGKDPNKAYGNLLMAFMNKLPVVAGKK